MKKWLASFICVLALLCLFTATAFAATITVYVKNVELPVGYYITTLSSSRVKGTPAADLTGYAYRKSANVLVLNNFLMSSGTTEKNGTISVSTSDLTGSDSGLTIEVYGDNRLRNNFLATDSSSWGSGISASSNLTIDLKDGAVLELEGSSRSTNSAGIFATKELTLTGNGSIFAYSGAVESGASYGVAVRNLNGSADAFTIEENVTLNAAGSDATSSTGRSAGIYVEQGNMVLDSAGASVIAVGGNSNYRSHGINVATTSSKLIVNAGSVIARAYSSDSTHPGRAMSPAPQVYSGATVQVNTTSNTVPSSEAYSANNISSYRYVRISGSADSHKHYACGETTCSNSTHRSADHSTVTYQPYIDGMTLYDGLNIYLTKDVRSISSNHFLLPANATVRLCLSGHDIIGGEDINALGVAGTLILCDCESGGKITHEKDASGTPVNGAAIFAGGTLHMYGGEVTGNALSGTSSGSGIQVYGTTNLYDGKIYSNTSRYGGGVSVYGGTLNMYGGEISDNTATSYGGGIYTHGTDYTISTVNLHGGTITRNIAGYGGGAYISNGSISMNGASITNNTATATVASAAGGLYVGTSASITMGGSATVTGNTAQGKASNVYLPTGKTITRSSSLTGSIGVTTQTKPTTSSPVTYMTNTLYSDLAKTFSDEGYSNRRDSEDSTLELYLRSYEIDVTGGTASHDEAATGTTVTITANTPPEGHTFKEWKVISGGVTIASPTSTKTTFVMGSSDVSIEAVFLSNHNHAVCAGSTACTGDAHTGHTVQNWTAWNGMTGLSKSGYYYLTSDVVNSDYISISGSDVHLCLNGHTISSNTYYNTLVVYGSLTLCDCGNGGTITHQTSSSSCYGYGVNVYSDASFTLYDGSIQNNKHNGNNNGGGVRVEGGTFSMYGGDITGNTSRVGGGGVLVTGGGSMYLHGGTIQNNTSFLNGGGIYSELSYLEIHGGTITGNTTGSDGKGGGVYIDQGISSNSNDFVMTGGTISQNSAKYGGGMYLYDTYSDIQNAVITGNTAGYTSGGMTLLYEGGGIGVINGSTILKNCTITSNRAASGGGIDADGPVQLQNTTISQNTATNQGGGINANAAVYVSGSTTVSSNTANGNANNVYLPAGKTMTRNGALTGAIGVTTENAPAIGTPVPYMTGATADDLSYTSSDAGQQKRHANGTLELYVPGYTVELINATAISGVTNGEANWGTLVTVKADAAPAGQIFDQWVLANITAVTNNELLQEELTFYMPKANVTVKATYIDVDDAHIHLLCGDSSCSHTSHSSAVRYQPWDGSSYLTLSTWSGPVYNLYLTGDATRQLEIPSGVTLNLCLNGHRYNYDSFVEADLTAAGGTLNLCDCGSGSIGDVRVEQSGTANLYDIKITNSNCTGLSIDTAATLNMYGGESSYHATGRDGAGLYASSSSTVLLSGVSITANDNCTDGTGYGAGMRIDSSNVTLENCTISNNSSYDRGGVAIYGNSVVTITNTTITGNTIADADYGRGGGIYITDSAHLTMNGGTVSNNTSARRGSGIMIESATAVATLNNVTITGNTGVHQDSAGIWFENGTLNVSGSTTVTGNSANSTTKNVYLPAGKTMTRTGALTGAIGVTTQNAPSVSAPIPYMTGATSDDLSHTSSDAEHQKRYANGTLEFCVPAYTISITVDPTEGGTVTGAGTYEHGENVTLTAAPATGYTFTNWTVDGEIVSTSATYTFTAETDLSLAAKFSKNAYSVSITVDPTEGGTVTGAGTYEHGDTVTLNASPATGYSFIGWFEDGAETPVCTDATYAFTAEETRNLVAKFSKNAYSVLITVDPTEGGTVTGAGNYEHGETVTLTASPSTGYSFIGWFEDSAETPVCTDTTYAFTAEETRNLVVKFSKNAYTISITAEPTEGGTVTGAGTYEHGENVTLTASPATGYSFIGWFEDGAEAPVCTNATYSFTAEETRNLVAKFSKNAYSVSITVDPTESGTVTGAGTYEHGETVTLNASPSAGYSFIGWFEDGAETPVCTNAAYAFTAEETRNLVAKFSKNAYSVSITVEPTEGGTVTGAGNYEHGETVTLTASPSTGYSFIGWFEDGAETPVCTDATYAFTAEKSHNLVAKFSAPDLVITVQPQDANVLSGSEVVFTVQASGAGNVSYRWQVDRGDGSGFADVGCSDAQYIIASALPMQNGWKYRCIVSDALTSLASEAALLTVTLSPAANGAVPPQTGDNTPLVLWTIMTVTSAAAITVLRKKRKA